MWWCRLLFCYWCPCWCVSIPTIPFWCPCLPSASQCLYLFWYHTRYHTEFHAIVVVTAMMPPYLPACHWYPPCHCHCLCSDWWPHLPPTCRVISSACLHACPYLPAPCYATHPCLPDSACATTCYPHQAHHCMPAHMRFMPDCAHMPACLPAFAWVSACACAAPPAPPCLPTWWCLQVQVVPPCRLPAAAAVFRWRCCWWWWWVECLPACLVCSTYAGVPHLLLYLPSCLPALAWRIFTGDYLHTHCIHTCLCPCHAVPPCVCLYISIYWIYVIPTVTLQHAVFIVPACIHTPFFTL